MKQHKVFEKYFLLLLTCTCIISSSHNTYNSTTDILLTNQSLQENDTFINPNDQRLSKWRTRLEKLGDDQLNESCICDRIIFHCEADCCCDTDCHQMEKFAFQRCLLPQHTMSDIDQRTHLCWPSFNFNRRKLDLAKASRLLCLARRTTAKQYFPNQQPINRYDTLLTIKPVHNFKWSDNNIAKQNFDTGLSVHLLDNVTTSLTVNLSQQEFAQNYQSGQRIIVVHVLTDQSNETLTKIDSRLNYWRLPALINWSGEGKCNQLRHVNYLHPYRTSCFRSIENFANSCTGDMFLDVEFYYKKLHFLYNNFLTNVRKLVPVKLKDSYSKVRYDPVRNICHNVVYSVNYTVYHQSIFGITDVLLHVNQRQVSNASKLIEQTFDVHFEWQNKKDLQQPYTKVRSIEQTKQGYMHRQEIIFAFAFNGSYKANRFSLLNTYKAGLCNEHHSLVSNLIQFGLNRVISCHLQTQVVSAKRKLCAEIGKELSKYLPQNQSNWYVAVSGDPSQTEDSTQWVPVLRKSHQGQQSLSNHWWTAECVNLSYAISLELYYSRKGSPNSGLYHILGATSQWHTLSPIKPKCDITDQKCHLALDIDLAITVDFIDITEPLRPEFTPAPSVKIELPSDFFYPFQANSATTAHHFLAMGVIIQQLGSSMIYSSFAISLFAAVWQAQFG